MTIHNQMKEIGNQYVPDPGALCCSFVAGLLPGEANRQAGPVAATKTGRLASVQPVQQSNGPSEKENPDRQSEITAAGDGTGQDDAPVLADGRQDLDPDLTHFFDELRRGLAVDYQFNEEQLVIFEANRFQWVCGPIRVVSYPRRPDATGWSVHVEFLDRDGNLGRYTFPQIELNTGRGGHVAAMIDMGLAVYAEPCWTTRVLQTWKDMPHSWRVDGAGWFSDPEGTTSFVRSDGRVHQPAGADIVPVVHASPVLDGRATAGSLEGWQQEVAAHALGNPALIFAISAALTGPLLHWSGIDTAGFNVFGPSGIGKSLILRLALSCSNAPMTLMPWSAAQTGLHRLSAQSQDGLLALDAFPRDPDSRHLKALLAIGDDAATGRILSPRDPDGGQRWRRVLLSGSELPLSSGLRRKKKDVPAALATRIVDIPAPTAGHGLVAELHGARDGSDFARRLEASMRRHHGHLLGAFLDHLVTGLPRIRAELDHRLPELTCHLQYYCRSSGETSPACRTAIAERFALVGFAGELGIRFRLLPWTEGSAREAVEAMASLAYHVPDPAVMEIEGSLGLLRGYVSRHADRIVDLAPDRPAEPPPDCVGWRDEAHIYLQGEPIEQELDDPDLFWNSLLDHDVLKPGGEQRSRQYKMPERKVQGRPRCYRVDRLVVEDNDIT